MNIYFVPWEEASPSPSSKPKKALPQRNDHWLKNIIDMKKRISFIVLSAMLTSMMLAGCSTSEDVDHTYTGKKLYELVKINLNETEKKYVERNNDFAF